MNIDRPWIALYSHTGSEIRRLSQRFSRSPDLIVTNKSRPSILTKHSVCTTSKPSTVDYRAIFDTISGDPIITLHGWMRIIPEEICREYDIYNLHPGLITQYPELKGKDPQDKVFTMLNSPSYVGCVIHKVIPEVDAGEVIMSTRVLNAYNSSNELKRVLHDIAGNMWVDFFKKQLYNR